MENMSNRSCFARRSTDDANKHVCLILDQEYADLLHEFQKQVSQQFYPKKIAKKYILQYALDNLKSEDVEKCFELIKDKLLNQKQSFLNK